MNTWLREDRYKIRLGGNIFLNVQTLIAYDNKPIFEIRRREEDGRLGVDCSIYDSDGSKIASVHRNNVHLTGSGQFELTRSLGRITLRNKKSQANLAEIVIGGYVLDVSLRTYLPNGQLLDLGPKGSTLPGLLMAGSEIRNFRVGIAIDPNGRTRLAVS